MNIHRKVILPVMIVLAAGLVLVLLQVVEAAGQARAQSGQFPFSQATAAVSPVSTGLSPALPETYADLELALKDWPDPLAAGDLLTYTLAVINYGPANATGITLTNLLPVNVELLYHPANCAVSGHSVGCHLNDLPVGTGQVIILVVKPKTAGGITDFASVSAVEPDPWAGNNSASAYTTVMLKQILGPLVSTVTPTEMINTTSVKVSVAGAHFAPGARAWLAAPTAAMTITAWLPLPTAAVVNDTLLSATIPNGVHPGTYALAVTNPDKRFGVLINGFNILADKPPVVHEVKPERVLNEGPTEMDIYGENFSTQATAHIKSSTMDITLEGIVFINSTHLRVTVPVALPWGKYDLTVINPDGRSAKLSDAFKVESGNSSDDLYANPTDLYSYPKAVHLGSPVQLGLNVRRKGGVMPLAGVQVDFYQGNPAGGGQKIGSSMTVPLAASGHGLTTPVTWTAQVSGTVSLYAVIDPANKVPEVDKTDNVISRTVWVHPALFDRQPPVVLEFLIDNRAASTAAQQVLLSENAVDPLPGSGVARVMLVEYEFQVSVNDWTPVAFSSWMPYDPDSDLPYRLHGSAGVHYLQAWAADRAGNVSLQPAAAMINYIPPAAHVAQAETHVFRLPLRAGDHLMLRLVSLVGDADLLAWNPDGSSAGRSETSLPVDSLIINAAQDGVYQVEVEGYTSADYRLEVVPVLSAVIQPRAPEEPERGRIDMIVPPESTPPPNIGLPGAPLGPFLLYCPGINK